MVLQQDLTTSKNILPAAGGATEALRTTVENRHGRISMEATLTEIATQRNQEVIRVEGTASGGILPLLNALAKRLDARATDFSTKNERALQALVGAAQATSLETRIRMLNDAISADSGFGLAYITLARTLREPEQVATILATASSHRNAFTAVDRAWVNVLATRISHAPLPQQEQAFSALLQLAPNDTDALAALGSERFLSGDASTGERLLKRALELSPGNPNARRQLAEGLFESRRFADAEKDFLGLDNNPAILPELAVCILLEGDTARADAVFDRYLALRPANDPFATILRGTWLALSGRRLKAIDVLNKTDFADPALRSVAFSQIAIWQLMDRDVTDAKKNATVAFESTRRPDSLGAVAVLIVQNDLAASQWRDRVNALKVNEEAKQTVLGYGLFLNGHYPEAAQVWQEITQRSGGADLRARTMFAASLDHMGKNDDPRRVLVQPFVPEFGDLFAAVSFGEMRRLLKLPGH